MPYHSEVVSNVLVIKSKKLDEYSIGVTEKDSFLGYVSSVDYLPASGIFSDGIVDHGADSEELYVSIKSFSVVLTINSS